MKRTLLGSLALPLFALACGSSSPNPATTNDGGVAGNDGGPEGGSATDAPVVVDCPAPTSGPTKHSGEVTENEVWTAAGSPHIVEYDVNVRDGHKLTIEPCARVQFAKEKGIRVAYPLTPNTGTLVAEGTAAHPIWFERQGADAWSGIYIAAPGTARLAHVELSGGGGGMGDGATLEVIGNGELPADPSLFVDHVTIKGSAGTGLWVRGGATFIAGSKDLTISGSGSDDSPFPAEIDEHSMDAFPTGTYTGNKVDEILLRTTGIGVAGAGLTVDATLHERGVPYRMGKEPNQSFYLGGKDGAPLATMTIEPGVIMRFVKGASLNIEKFTGVFPAQAAIRAIGTAAKPIVFTSASPTPAPGDWMGLWFGGALSAQNKLDHVRIEYAGGECSCILATCNNITESEGAVILTNQAPSAFITNTVFKASAQHAITEGFEGTPVDFLPTNTFESIGGCRQTLPLFVRPLSCGNPAPSCN
ncbi:MAG: hypothetical protein HOO96_35040 [Polyangiaceae bacterium]|nr:hypothetical protein [Polyangiaceae bacterium]